MPRTIKTISKDTPIAEITLRKYEKPYEMSHRELVRKFCLSTGLLQPGDSRDVIVDILYVLLKARKEKGELSSDEIRALVIDSRKDASLSQAGIAASNIRRQLKRMRDMFLVEKVRNCYRINEHDSMNNIFREKIEQYLLHAVVGRVREYLDVIDKEF
ncbi:MAG TPA: hypothetical protein VJI75_06960 [Candidatus Nanoarchaeia archaeon]|nr:hypothetical protein [Candidatus Nanoarchaeia archaeon]